MVAFVRHFGDAHRIPAEMKHSQVIQTVNATPNTVAATEFSSNRGVARTIPMPSVKNLISSKIVTPTANPDSVTIMPRLPLPRRVSVENAQPPLQTAPIPKSTPPKTPDHAMPKLSATGRAAPIHHTSQIVTPVTHSTVLAKLRSMNARRVVKISSIALTVQMLVRSAKKPTRPARAKNKIQTTKWISTVLTAEIGD